MKIVQKPIILILVGVMLTLLFTVDINLAQNIPSDESILTQLPCHVPCWYGLLPGQSTFQDVTAAIPNIPFVSSADRQGQSQVNSSLYTSWTYTEAPGIAGGTFVFKDNLLHSIRVSPNLSFSLQDILSRYGNPAAFTTSYLIGSETETAFLDLTLYYPDLGMIVIFDIYSGNPPLTSYDLLPEAAGKGFELYEASGSLEQLVADQYDYSIETAQAIIQVNFFSGWPGLYSTIVDPKEPIVGNIPVTPQIATALPATQTQVATLATKTPTPTPTPSPTPPPADRIAFATNRDGGNLELYSMNTDGSNPTRLTTNTAVEAYPVWSPDRSKLVFASNRDGNYEIYAMNADGSGQTRLTNHSAEDGTPSWSPDGTKILFSSRRDGNIEIYVMNADGSAQTRLTNHSADDSVPHWKPDGTKIAFASTRDGNAEIYTMNPDGTGVTRLTTNAVIDVYPVWSPDGTKIAFASNRDGNFEVYVMNADGSGQVRLTTNSAADGFHPAAANENYYGITWSPDGTQIVFISLRDGNQELYVTDGTITTRLTSSTAIDSFPDW